MEDNSTVVFYIPENVTVTANGFIAMAGITLNSNSTLIIVGSGTLNANGGDGSDAAKGGGGGNGTHNNSNDTYKGGDGGDGGHGAYGGGAGIGGNGGYGGSGGDGGLGPSKKRNAGNDAGGGNGSNGLRGGDGGSMGTVYVIGFVTVMSTGGNAGNDADGGNAGSGESQKSWNYYTAGGGGGGAGGGSSAPGKSIGSGGPGGGGGGGGGAGGIYQTAPVKDPYYTGGVGGSAGIGVYFNGGAGSDAVWNGSPNVSRASGGSGGVAGSFGSDGKLYAQYHTIISGRKVDGKTDGKLSQLQYTVTFNNQKATTSGAERSYVYLGQKMTTIITPTKAGYSFQGYYTEENGGGSIYYNEVGQAMREWDLVGDKTLYAYWTPKVYTISFDRQGGNGGTSSVRAEYNAAMPSISTPTRLGYNFQGYFTGMNGSGNKYYNANGTSVRNCNFTSNTTLYAHWTGISYSVRYNSNLSPNTTSSQSGFTYGISQALQRNTFVRTGYIFKGWATSVDGGVVYYDGVSVSKLTTSHASTVDLYAVWQAKTYTLTANANGGSIPTTSGWSGSGASASKTITFDSTYGTLPTPTRTGHTFAGWYTAASSGEAVSATTGVTTTGNRTIYAHWTANNYTLTADANMTGATFTSVPSGWSGSGTTRTRSVTYNTSYGILPTPAKEGYIFLGWYTAASGGSSVYSSTTMGAGNTRIYAHWEKTWAADAVDVNLIGLGGSGTTSDPYVIDSATDIAFLALQTSKNVTFDGKYFKQTTNIDLEGKTWLPIGNATTAFQGSYDGNGYLITNITTIANGQLNYSNVGLFGYTRNATIKNVNIISGTIQGYDYVGSIVGNLNNGSIENCRSGATVTGHNYVGMIGYGISTSILSSYNYGSVSGNDYVGGILGRNGGTGTRLENCYMKGGVTATASNANCGGILGQTTSGITLQSCGFIGSVTGGSNTGLLTGNLNGGSVIDCFANSTTNYDFTKGSGTIKSSLYIQNKDSNNQVKKYVTHNSETNPFANWTVAVNSQPLPKGFSWISSSGGNLTMEKLEKLGYTRL